MIDYRHHQTPVRHQGDRATCVGFAVSAAHEWIATDDVIRSAEDALWAGHQEGDLPDREETSVDLTLAGLSHLEHAEEVAWPYGDPPWPASRPEAAKLPEHRRALPSWRELPSTWEHCRDALERGNALLLTLRLVMGSWIYGNPDVDAPPGKKAPTNHAVLAVGVVDDEPESVIVKNSWGEQWGAAGYGFVSRQYLDHYGVRAHALER